MFDDSRSAAKPRERAIARELRRAGEPYRRIADALGVSASTAFNWTHDIELTDEQIEHNLTGPHGPHGPEQIARRADTIRANARARRVEYQRRGRIAARAGDPLHLAGCMLYWAEGAKNRNCIRLSNSEIGMLAYFRRFLTECFQVEPARMTFSVHVYLGNGLSIEQVEQRWLDALELPRSSLRKHSINPLPTSSSGGKRNRLPYGVGNLCHCSTEIVQHIFGAIQEYGGFDEPRWLG